MSTTTSTEPKKVTCFKDLNPPEGQQFEIRARVPEDTFEKGGDKDPSKLVVVSEKEFFEKFNAFVPWYRRISAALKAYNEDPLEPVKYSLNEIIVDSVTPFSPNRIGFAKIQADLIKADGNLGVPGSVFLRGPCVAMLVIVQPPDTTTDGKINPGKPHVILTKQARVPAGSFRFLEIPAGMIDKHGNTSNLKAIGELEEETGMTVPIEELTDLTDLAAGGDGNNDKARLSFEEGSDDLLKLEDAIYPSAGGCDEDIRLYCHARRVSWEMFDDLQGRTAGLEEEGEHITLKVVPLEDLYKEGRHDAKALSALALYSALKEKLPFWDHGSEMPLTEEERKANKAEKDSKK